MLTTSNVYSSPCAGCHGVLALGGMAIGSILGCREQIATASHFAAPREVIRACWRTLRAVAGLYETKKLICRSADGSFVDIVPYF
jgi:hypothetical protein